MAEKSKGQLVVVEWDEVSGKEVNEKKLKQFIKTKSDSEPVIKLGTRRGKALIEFKKDKDVNFLRTQWKDDTFWIVKELYTVPETKVAKVKNLPHDAVRRGVRDYFTNHNMVKIKLSLEVPEEYFRPKDGICLLNLRSAEDVKRTCKENKNFKKFKDCNIVLEPFYEQVDTFNESSSNKDVQISPIDIDNIEGMKIRFMKDFCRGEIEDQFKSVCAQVKWAKDGIHKVRFQFNCQHEDKKKKHSQSWEVDVRKKFEGILNDIVVVKKNLAPGVWTKVRDVLGKFRSRAVLVEEDDFDYRVTIVGYRTDSDIVQLETDIDAIQPPKPLDKKDIEVKNKIKLRAFKDLEMHEAVGAVTVDYKVEKGILTIQGDKEAVDKSELEILQILAQLVVQTSNFKSIDQAKILTTDLMRDQIESCKDDQGKRWGYFIDKDTLIVFSMGEADLEKVQSSIMSFITEEDFKLEGTVDNGKFLKQTVKEIENEYTPYVVLTCDINKDNVVVHIVCGKDYYNTLKEALKMKVEVLLIKTEDIYIAPYIVRYIQANAMDIIKTHLKESGIQKDVIESNTEESSLKVTGNAAIRQKVLDIIQAEAKKIHASWKVIEVEGIHDYFADGEGYAFLKNENNSHKCDFRIATQYEMKKESVHCIIALESGQALFVGTGSLTEPPFPVDAIVNAANTELDHRGGLAGALVKAGGKSIQDDCTMHVKKNGELRPGDVYVGIPGKLPCQRIIHAVGPEWKGGSNNEDSILQTTVEHVIEEMDKSKDFILRSVAIPLISAGVFGFPRARSAKIILETMRDMLKKVPSVREVYFYDVNPDIVRTIQKQMHSLFGDKCFHMPVQNIGLGKGTMTKLVLSRMFKLERTGSRTLPLPGRKKITIKWGELHSTAADVLVNVTPTAPTPTGKVTDGLKTAVGVKYSLISECQKAFRNNPNNDVPDGTMVKTKAGRIPECNEIYHIKIKPSWDSRQTLADYIKSCLQEAVRQKRKSIAFPLIGTADCGYPGDVVASTFIRTVGDFMKLHVSCSLKDIIVVIFKEDIANTSAFEVTLEELYSQRPHRLVADIQEKVEQKKTKEGKEEERETGRVKQRSTSPQRPQRPQSAAYGKHRGRPSATEGSFTVDRHADVTVDVQVGGIEYSDADAVVCTTSSFPRLNGAIANAIKNVGGSSIQGECNANYKSYPDQGVASTKAGNLSCKRVFYVVLKDFQRDGNLAIYNAVTRCLEQALKEKIASVAMPTFGTGGFKYPDKIAASETFEAIKDFYQSKRAFPKLITIVMFGKAPQTCQAFFQEAAQTFTQIKAPTPVPIPVVKPEKSAEVQKTVGDIRLWNVPKTSTTLEITYGNLELAKTDVILDTTTSFPKLNGIIPSSICKKAGPQLLQECDSYKGNVTSGMIVRTKGYDLDCKEVYHYVMPNWTESDGEQAITNCIDDCLQLMKGSGHTSIAVPSIGTGGAKYNPKKVAHGMYRAVSDFAAANRDVKCHLHLVLYPAATPVNTIFVEELQAFMKECQKAGQKLVKTVRFESDTSSEKDSAADVHTYSDENIVIPTNRRDFLLLQFISDEKKKVELALQSIKAKVASETKEVTVHLKKENNMDDLDLVVADKERNKKEIEEIGESYRVRVTVNIKDRKVKIKGLGDSVTKCYERILKFLNNTRREAVEWGIGQIVYQHIEWYYTEDNGNLWVPYPKHISFQLEDAHANQGNEKEFRDSDEQLYVVDFQKMEEYIKEKKDKQTTISVIRKDLTEGALRGLPPSWQTMTETENLVEVPLQTSHQEYKDVETNLKKTIGNFGISQIKEIRRIQNKTLYQQYQTKKQQLEKDNKANPNLQIERTLWHGIKADTEKSITSTGFNRGFAGATFAHAWYGLGVYFAVNSEYSTDNNYSPPGADGWKRVYQAKVLTGQSCEVQRGYQDRFAPLIPGSNIDRFNSTCDSVASPTEFVIFNDTQAYPEYIILFK